IASVIPRAGQTPLLRGVLLDITAQRRADEALRALNERLSVQTEVAKATAGSMTPEELCDRLLAVVVEVMPADSFYVDRWNPETEQTKGIRNFDLVNGKLTPVPVLDVVLGHEGRLWSEVISGRRPLLIHRERAEITEPGFVPFGETDRPSASLLYAPMIVSNRLVGVMSVQSYRPQAYTQRHVDLLMAIAQQAAPALEATLLAERLRESEERHRLIFEHASEGIAMVDPEERYLWANTAHCVQMGVEPGGLTGRSLREFVEAETWERLTRETAKRRQGIVSRYELRIRQPGGTERLLFISAIPIFGPDGAFQGTQGFLMDITERKRAEEERERLAKAVEQSAEIIIVTDANHVIEYVNPAFERITGYTAAEAIGQTPRLLQNPGHDAALAADLRATLARGDVWTGEFTDRCKDGSHVRLQVTISPVRDARGVVTNFVSVQRDVTRESEMADQLRQAQKMEAVGQLAGGVAHDFNNLLLAILGFTDMVIETLDEGDPRRTDLREVQRAAERASSLTRQLLAFSRRQMLRPVDVDLDDVVADIVKMLRRVIGEHIELEIVRSEAPGRVNADPGQIQQVLINLCVNARDAMPGGGKIVIETGTATLGMDFVKERGGTEAGRYAVLSVRDTGEGIPPDVLPRIFEPFFTTKGVGEGTGLGLATVYGIVAQHGGLVDVESTPGQGATFRVYLPEVESSSPAAAAEAPAIAGGTETILLAEDEQTVRALATRMLTRAGYRVLEAVNGVEAVRIASDPDVHIDMALLDVIMPAMGGREAHDRIAAVRPGIRFLFTSGYSPAGVIREFLDQPGRRLLLKPYSVTDLLGMVREVLDS
ncbi:MAG: PAS domain S-box protein, partial [Candidatus Sumerlaeia bacterium]|nr:PAS domain S-box protein [Candidatus Sumerlaeia bacterium]